MRKQEPGPPGTSSPMSPAPVGPVSGAVVQRGISGERGITPAAQRPEFLIAHDEQLVEPEMLARINAARAHPSPGIPHEEIVREFGVTPPSLVLARSRSGKLAQFTTDRLIPTASALLSLLSKLALPQPTLLFRGQSDAHAGLEPSIERVTADGTTWPAKEEYIRREFKRRAHHYLLDLPREEDELGWLALMRHHGAPSRLLDWTNSPFVAAFFAALGAKDNERFVVWAINQAKLKQRALGVLRDPDVMAILRERNGQFKEEDLASWEQFIGSPENFRAAFLSPEPRRSPNRRSARPLPRLVVPVEPYRTNERLTIQQGLFVCANSVARPFEETLQAELCDAKAGRSWLHKLVVEPGARFELLAQLDKMNITEATLYPGLDGFARSLRISAEIAGKETGQTLL